MTMPKNEQPQLNLNNNLSEVNRLLEIHLQLVGNKPGYKHNVAVLNKSAIILLVACWEAFIEDLAETAYNIILRRATNYSQINNKVLGCVGKYIKESKNDLEVWQLAGTGWKNELQKYKEDLFSRYIGKLNTPRREQVDELYKMLFGIPSISTNWHWGGMKTENAIKKLDRLITIRGAISHRVTASNKIYKEHVVDYTSFINHLSIAMSNSIRTEIIKLTTTEPWPLYNYE
jgi:hypothetical protein